jgi:hypothetical protein
MNTTNVLSSPELNDGRVPSFKKFSWRHIHVFLFCWVHFDIFAVLLVSNLSYFRICHFDFLK